MKRHQTENYRRLKRRNRVLNIVSVKTSKENIKINVLFIFYFFYLIYNGITTHKNKKNDASFNNSSTSFSKVKEVKSRIFSILLLTTWLLLSNSSFSESIKSWSWTNSQKRFSEVLEEEVKLKVDTTLVLNTTENVQSLNYSKIVLWNISDVTTNSFDFWKTPLSLPEVVSWSLLEWKRDTPIKLDTKVKTVSERSQEIIDKIRIKLSENQIKWLESIIPLALNLEEKKWIPYEVTLSQASLESWFWEFSSWHNVFGIMSWKGEKVKFRSLKASFSSYARTLLNERYKLAFTTIRKTGSLRSFVEIVQQKGYCPESTYTRKVISVMKWLGLYKKVREDYIKPEEDT